MLSRYHQSSCEAERKRCTPHAVVNAFRVGGVPLVLDPPLHEQIRTSTTRHRLQAATVFLSSACEVHCEQPNMHHRRRRSMSACSATQATSCNTFLSSACKVHCEQPNMHYRRRRSISACCALPEPRNAAYLRSGPAICAPAASGAAWLPLPMPASTFKSSIYCSKPRNVLAGGGCTCAGCRIFTCPSFTLANPRS